MPISITINKAEQLDRTVSTLVNSGVTFSSYQTPEWFMFLPATTGSFDNVVGVTIAGLDGIVSHTVKIYASKYNNYEQIISNGYPLYELYSTTVTANNTYNYTVSLTSGDLPPSDCYYIFAIIDEGTSDETLSSYHNVTISHNDLFSNTGYGQFSSIGKNITDEQFISEMAFWFKPKFIMIDILYNVTRDITLTATLEEFTGNTASTKLYLTFDPYTGNWKCLSICKANVTTTETNEAYLDTNKIYIARSDGDVVAFTLSYVDGYGLVISSDDTTKEINPFLYHFIAYGGLSLKTEIVQSVANTSSVAFSFDPSLVMIDGGCGLIDGGNAKRSYSTNNYVDTFGALDRSDTTSQTFCYASYAGVCKSYTDASSEAVIAANPDPVTDNYKLVFNSFGTKQINVTYTGDSGFNSYILYFIALHFPINGSFQNVTSIVSGTPSTITSTFHDAATSFLTYQNYTKSDDTDTYHSAYTLSFFTSKRRYKPSEKLNYNGVSAEYSVGGRYFINGALSTSYQFIQSTNYLYSRSDTFLTTSFGDNNVNSKTIAYTATNGIVAQVVGGTFTNLYTFSTIATISMRAGTDNMIGTFSNTSFDGTVTRKPYGLLHHDQSSTIYGNGNVAKDYRIFLTDTIDFSGKNILDVTSIISSIDTSGIYLNAFNTLSGTEKFYNRSTAYLTVIEHDQINPFEPIPIIITTSNAEDYRTHVKSFAATEGKTLIFDEQAEGFKFSAAIITLTDGGTLPYEDIAVSSTRYSIVQLSYNYFTKFLKSAYVSKYHDNSNVRTVSSNTFYMTGYKETTAGTVLAKSTSPYYETEKINFSYKPGVGLYVESYNSPGIVANIIVFGGPSLLSDLNTYVSYTTSYFAYSSFRPTMQFFMNSTVTGTTDTKSIVASNNDISFGFMNDLSTKELGYIANSKLVNASGSKQVAGGLTAVSRQITATSYNVTFGSESYSTTQTNGYYRYAFSSSGTSDNVYFLSLFTGSLCPSIKKTTITLPTSGGNSSFDISHATTSGAQAVIGLYYEQQTTSTPADTTSYTGGSLAIGFASLTKDGLKQSAFESNKSYSSVAAYHTRFHNSKYIKTIGTYSVTSGEPYSRNTIITNLKSGAGPYDVSHYIEAEATASNTIYGTFVEAAFPIGSGILMPNGPLDFRYNFEEGMTIENSDSSIVISPVTLSYSFQSGLETFFHPYQSTPLSLSYGLNNNALTYTNTISVSDISLYYTLNNIDIVRIFDVGTPISLSYNFESLSLVNVQNIAITPINLSYTLNNLNLEGSINISLSDLSLSYNLVSNQIDHLLNLTASPLSFSYNLTTNSFSHSIDKPITVLSLSYGFGSASIVNGNSIEQSTPLSLSYTLNTISLEHNLSLTASPLTMIYGFEALSFQYTNIFNHSSPISLIYNFDSYNFNYSLNLEQTNPHYYSLAIQNNQLSYSNSFSLSDIALSYTLNTITISNNGEFSITPITMSYSLNNMTIVNSLSLPVTPITLSYNLENNDFTYSNNISISNINIAYSLENNNIDYTNNIAITPKTMNYTFGTMSFGNIIVIEQTAPINVTYNIQNNNITYLNELTFTPLSYNYNYQTYYMTNSITLNQSFMLPIYLVVNSLTNDFSNTISIGELNQNFSFVNNQFQYSNNIPISELNFGYTINGLTKNDYNDFSIGSINLNYSFGSSTIVNGGNIELTVGTPLELSYTLNNINIQVGTPIELSSGDVLRNYIIFEPGMNMNVPSFTTLTNGSPLNIGYFNFDSYQMVVPDRIYLNHNIPLNNNYNFGTSYMFVDHDFNINAPIGFTYNFDPALYMRVDIDYDISELNINYAFGTFTLLNITDVFQTTPLTMAYSFGSHAIEYNKSIAITPITMNIDFNDSAMFLEFSNQLKYDNLVASFTTTKLTVKYLK